MHPVSVFVVRLVPLVAGGLAALLVARLAARLLAARPDNPAFARLYLVTQPLVAPLGRLDAGQPQYGAVLELSTLALIVLILVIGFLVWYALRGRHPDGPPHKEGQDG
ncbi:MAG: YggT family protein [Chloroflexaceae bacterium]|nr:YggT family protein [Chloroflexaceae bacterium]NJO06844.1 YggT family protein [Chloroflexaceae bacterium]